MVDAEEIWAAQKFFLDVGRGLHAEYTLNTRRADSKQTRRFRGAHLEDTDIFGILKSQHFRRPQRVLRVCSECTQSVLRVCSTAAQLPSASFEVLQHPLTVNSASTRSPLGVHSKSTRRPSMCRTKQATKQATNQTTVSVMYERQA